MKTLLRFLIFLGVIAAVYFPALGGQFLYWDDTMNIRDNPLMRDGPISYFWTHQYFNIYIPVTYTIWTAVIRLWDSPMAFHLLNILIHALNATLVFALIEKLFARTDLDAKTKTKTTTDKYLPWFVALIFAVHPLQNEAVAWISGGRDILGAFFGLAAVAVFLRGSRKLDLVAATLLFLTSLLAKPTMVTIPAAFLCLSVFRAMITTHQKYVLALWFGIAAGFAFLARGIQSGITARLVVPLPFYQDLVIGFDSLGFYFQKFFLPYPITSDYARWPLKVFDQQLWMYSLPLVAALAAIAIYFYKRKSTYSWDGLLFFMVSLSPILGFVPFMAQSQSSVADRYVYWAFIGPAFLVGQLFTSNIWAKRAGIAILVAWAAVSFNRSFIYKDNAVFFAEMLKHAPDSYVGNNSMGVVHFEAGRQAMAEEFLWKAHRVNPLHPTAASNITQLYFITKRYEEIQKQLEPLLQNPEFVQNNVANPDSLLKMYKYVARSQVQQGRLQEAYASYCSHYRIAPWDNETNSEFDRLARELKARGIDFPPCRN